MILLINYSHKWWYKALSVLLVVALILAISFGSATQAHAVGVLTMTVCAGILTVMAGAGIYAVVSGMAAGDIQSWLQGKLQEWDIYRNDGNIFTDLIEENLFVMTVKGILRIGNSAAQGISNFITWLVSDLGLSNNSIETVVTGSNKLNGFDCYDGVEFSGYGTAYQPIYSQSDDIYVLLCKNYNNVVYSVAVSSASFSANNPRYNQYFNSWKSGNNYFYTQSWDSSWNNYLTSYTIYNVNDVSDFIANFTGTLTLNTTGTLALDSDVIGIPDVTQDTNEDVYLGVDGVYPGASVEEWTDVVMDGVLDNTLDTTMTVTDEYVDAVEAVVINEQPISVNTDHHMIGFTNLPDFVNLNLNSIWHYVSDAVEYASGFISWFVNLLTSVPTLAIPLYMSFTLLIVLSFIRRILL